MITKPLLIFASALIATFPISCVNMRGAGSETANEICRQNGQALPSRSVEDTPQTIEEITRAYATFAITCPEWAHLIPE